MKRPITGQYKMNLDTGEVYVVGSKATERPNLEKQASLLQWAEDKAKLERWQEGLSRIRVDCVRLMLTMDYVCWRRFLVRLPSVVADAGGADPALCLGVVSAGR